MEEFRKPRFSIEKWGLLFLSKYFKEACIMKKTLFLLGMVHLLLSLSNILT